MAVPIHTTMAYSFVIGKEVGEARNAFAEQAIRENYRYIFFRDDDTLIPRESLSRLYALHVPIAAGVYFSKTYPPEPLIFRHGRMAGVQEWAMGEVLTDIDSCGMGCTLIDVDVFRKLKESNPDLPFFKTEDTSLSLRGGVPGIMTEDIYFLTRCHDELRMKTEKVGDTFSTTIYTNAEAPEDAVTLRPIIDTGTQCSHIDSRTWIQFGYDEKHRIPVWAEPNGSTHAIPPFGSPVYERGLNGNGNGNGHKHDGPLKFNMGCGSVKIDGVIGVDLNKDQNPDLVRDFRDVSWIRKEYGRGADGIYSAHALEHIPHLEVIGTIRSWALALDPGGELEIGVPDFWWCVEELKKNDRDTLSWQRIFGAQRYMGDEHRTGFSKTRLEAIISAMPMLKIESIDTLHPETDNQPTIWLRARRLADWDVNAVQEVPKEEECPTTT